jgi:hypothetical protein
MKTFRDHLKEEVKIGALASGGIDIERDAIRDEINGILSAIASRPCVTPYASLNKIRKALAYFHIHLPKRVYLEGRHGIEVWEINQFGHKMGVTDQGEWINHVPAKFHLFFHYHRVGSMYYLEAKIVDDKELESRVSSAERMVAEEMDAAMRQDFAKAKAPKEDPHTALGDCDCSQGDSPSTKKAVKVSMKKIDEDKDPCWKGYEMVGMKKKGGRKVPNCVPVKEEEQIDEISKGLARRYVKAAKTDIADLNRATGSLDKFHATAKTAKRRKEIDDQFEKNMQKSDKRRSGIKKAESRLKEEQIDELSKKTLGSYVKKASVDLYGRGALRAYDIVKGKDPNTLRDKRAGNRVKGIYKASDKLAKEETQVDEKLTKDMSAGDVISDFVHSKDPKFEGKSKKMRQKMALGAYYGMHPEKSKD